MNHGKFKLFGSFFLLGAIAVGPAWLAWSSVQPQNVNFESRLVRQDDSGDSDLPTDWWWSPNFPAVARHESVTDVLNADAPVNESRVVKQDDSPTLPTDWWWSPNFPAIARHEAVTEVVNVNAPGSTESNL